MKIHFSVDTFREIVSMKALGRTVIKICCDFNDSFNRVIKARSMKKDPAIHVFDIGLRKKFPSA